MRTRQLAKQSIGVIGGLARGQEREMRNKKDRPKERNIEKEGGREGAR